MPGAGATDPADIEAIARRELGFSRQLEQDRRAPPHPSRGGAPGYPLSFRQAEQARHHNGEATVASAKSIRRWDVRIIPYRMTGNKARSQIVGIDMVNLVTFIIAYPDSTQEEMAVYIYNSGGDLYSKKTISERLKELDITKKKASTEAYQAQRADVQFRLECFFEQPLVPRFKLIDIDEFGITLEKCNRTRGWALKIFRVRKDGHYHHGSKLTCLFAIEPGDPRVQPHIRGSLQRPRRWLRILRAAGTTTNLFRDFCDYICSDIEANPLPLTDDHRVLMWDNLSAHYSNYVHQTVTGRPGNRFSIIARPQYHPKIAPIEYKICDLVSNVSWEKEADWDMTALEQALQANLWTKIGPFDSTFYHCGYRWVLDANGNVVRQP